MLVWKNLILCELLMGVGYITKDFHFRQGKEIKQNWSVFKRFMGRRTSANAGIIGKVKIVENRMAGTKRAKAIRGGEKTGGIKMYLEVIL